MRRLLIFAVFVFLASVFIFSCYYDNTEALYPELCDTTNITFTTSLDTTSLNTTIVSILMKNCYTCHSNANAPFNTNGKDVRLEDYADVVARASQISQAINHTGPPSIIPMPYNGAKLDQCTITLFDTWYLNGMKFN